MKPAGGTELQYKFFKKYVAPELLDQFQICLSVPGRVPIAANKINILWQKMAPDQPHFQEFFKDPKIYKRYYKGPLNASSIEKIWLSISSAQKRQVQQLFDTQAKNIKESGKDIAGINMDNYKKSNMKNNRLTELIKTALKGPLNEATDLVDRDGYQFTRFSMGEEGPGLQITSQGGNYITIPGSKLGVFVSALTDAIRVFDDSKRQLPVSEKKTDQDKDGDNDFDDVKIARMKASGMSHDDAVKKVKGKVDEASKAGKLRIPKDIEKLLQDAHGDFVAGKIDGIELGERLDQILNNPQGPDPNVKGYYGPTNFTVDMDLDEDKDFIQKAIKRPGALRKKLGVKKGEDIPKGKINKAIAKLKKKDKDKEKEGTQLGAADERELRQLNLAKTLSKLKEETLSERIFKELRK